MASKVMNSDSVLSDNEGVSLGKVGSYIKRFKDQEKTTGTIPFNPKKAFSNQDEEERPIPSRKINKPADPNILPAELTPENEKTVYVYYYTKFGNLDCDDFESVKGKIASAINRLFNKQLTPSDALAKLDQYVTPADIDLDSSDDSVVVSSKVSSIKKLVSIKIELNEAPYRYIKGLNPLSIEQLDLVRFVDSSKICFSSDGYNFYLATHPEHSNCFDDLFNFSPNEDLVYSMFKDQLGDDHKAKKLVLMSRMLNQPAESKPRKNISKTK